MATRSSLSFAGSTRDLSAMSCLDIMNSGARFTASTATNSPWRK